MKDEGSAAGKRGLVSIFHNVDVSKSHSKGPTNGICEEADNSKDCKIFENDLQ